MASTTAQTPSTSLGQPIGKVMIVTGTVKAVAPDGTERVLTPNSPIFANETIVTGSDGMVSLVFNDAGHTQLDLGRMSEVTLDHDVYSGEAPASTADEAAKVEQIQQALAAGEFDPTTQLEAAAAGVVAGATTTDGGGHPTVVFDLTAAEILPDSGAETTGPNLGFVGSIVEEIPPAEAAIPTAAPDINEDTEGHVENGDTIGGNILENDTSGDGSITVISIEIGGVTYDIPPGGEITVPTPLDEGSFLTIDSAGNYTYHPPHSVNHDTNNDGIEERVSEIFPYTIINSDGQTATSYLEIVIADTEPTAVDDAATMEGESRSIVIDVQANDIERADVVAWDNGAKVFLASDPTQGTAVYNNDGTFTYTANRGANGTDSFTYTITDADGDTSTAKVTITLNLNEPPVAADDTNWVQEAGDGGEQYPGDYAPTVSSIAANTVASGNVLANLDHTRLTTGDFADVADTDVDGDSLSVTTTGSFTGAYGTLTLNADGSYSYALNNSNADVDALDDGESLTDTFNYTASDGTTSADATLTITIFGTNDAPVANADTNWVDEDSEMASVSGNVLANLDHTRLTTGDFADVADTDVDGDTLSVTTTGSFTGAYGTLALNADGSYSYELNNSNADVDALDDGESLTDTFNYTASDGTTSADATLTITIFGTNDAPVANADTNWVQEAGDGGEQYPGDYAPTVSSIAANTVASGNVLANLDHTHLTTGDFADVADTDVDGDTLSVTTTGSFTGAYGTLALNADGSYSYELNNSNADVDALDDGESLTDSFNYTASDGTATADATLTITIFGTNDAPVANADTNWVDEDSEVASVSGNVLANLDHTRLTTGDFADVADTDVDGDSLSVTTTGDFTGAYGTLTLNADGSYSYALDNGNADVDALDDGESLTDSFNYTASDGTTSADATLTITIFGTNDAPVANADTNWVDEDSEMASVSGNVLANLDHTRLTTGDFADVADTDVDGDTLSVTTTGSFTGAYGTLALNADGSYSYELNNSNADVDALDDGESLTDTFNYTASDGTTSANATLTITIFGTNDAPVANADTNWVQEADDGGEQYPGDYAPTVSSIAANTVASGNVLANLDHTHLTTGDFADVADTDVDGDTLSVTTTGSFTGAYGTLALNADGSYSYELNNSNADVDALDDGESLTDSFNYTASDGTATADATLTITIFGTNDAPVANADTNWVDEDSEVASVSGNVLANLDHTRLTTGDFADVADTDVDGDSLSVTTTGDFTGAYGTLTLNADGSYSYALDNGNADVDALDDGESLTDSFNYTASDGTTSADATLTITIFGTNDAPVANADTNWVDEDSEMASVSGNVLANLDHTRLTTGDFADVADTDVDGDTLSVTTTGSFTGAYGTLALNADGSYSYALDNGNADVDALDDGESLTDTFNYTASDGTTSADATLTITIFGTNDAPVANADTNWVQEAGDGGEQYPGDYAPTVSSIAANTVASGNVLANLDHTRLTSGDFADVVDTDVDGDTLSVTTTGIFAGAYGTLTLNADGGYEYVLDNSHADVDALDDGESLTDSFNYTASDGTATANATLTITIFGTNDAPVAVDDTNTMTEDQTSVSGNVITNDTDIDGETLTVVGTPITLNHQYGTLAINSATGGYTFTLNAAGIAQAQTLDTGESMDIAFADAYQNTDGTANSNMADVTITVTGENDAPVAVDDTNTMTEDQTSVSGNVITNDTDIDGETLTVVGTPITLNHQYGTLAINSATGGYTFTLNAAGIAQAQTLDTGESMDIAFADAYQNTDGTANSNMADVTITVTGENDAPVAVDDTNTMTEDQTSVSGNVITNDTDIDGETLTVVGTPITLNHQYGTLAINSATGGYTFTLNAAGIAQAQTLDTGESMDIAFADAYQNTDGTANSNMADVTITVTGENDAPVAVDDTNTMTEDQTSVSGNVITNDTDIDGETLTVVGTPITLNHQYGTLAINSATGGYTFTLNAAGIAQAQTLDTGESMDIAFADAYQNTDGTANSNMADVTITVTGENDAPVAVDDTNTMTEDQTSVSGNVITNDTDIDGETLTVVGTPITLNHQYGTLAINSATGGYTFTLNAAGIAQAQTLDTGESMDIAFADAYQNTDGTANSNMADVTITVTGENDAPVAVDDTNTMTEDQTSVSGNVITNDTDIDGETLTVVGTPITLNHQYGTLAINSATGGYTFTLNAAGIAQAQTLDTGESMDIAFADAYQNTDGTANSNMADVTITVTGENDAPVAVDDTNTMTEDQTSVSGNVITNDTDIDGETLTVVGTPITLNHQYGTLAINSATGGYTFTLNAAGIAQAQTLDTGESMDIAFADAYQNTDGTANSNMADVTITVTGENDAPVAVDDTNTMTEDQTSVSGNVITNDTDIDGETLTVVGTPITLNHQYGTLAINSATGGYTFTLNAAGIAQAQTLDTGESMDIAFADAYQNTDGTANSNMADVTITVTGENDAPVAVDDTNTMTEDQTSVSGNVITNDTDIDGETLTVVGTPITLNHQYGTLAINSATGGYTFTLNAAGIAQAQTLDTGESMDIAFADAYQNTDGTANSNMADVTITVTGENDAPVAVDDTNTMTEDQTSVSGNVITNDTDIDGETLTVVGTPITLNHQYGTLAINSATGGYTFTLNAAGIAQAQTLDTGESMDIAFADAYQNTDGTANSNMADVTITVTGENDAPVAVDDTNTMTEDQTSVSGNVITNDTDIDGETLTVVGTPITLNHQYGTLAINSATGGYTFTLNAAGIAQAQTLDTGESMDIAFADAYQNTDGTANSNMADVTITVTGENDAPVAVDDTNTMTEDQTSVSGNVITNDTDIDGETLTVVGTPITLNHQYGTLAINSATGGYTFTLNAAGIAQAQTLDTGESMDIAFADAYQNTDGTANSNMADVTITVTGENDAPVAVDDTNTMTEDQTSVSGNVITNDTDIDGETLTVVGTPITLNHQYGTLAINSATGGYTFTLNAAGIAQAQTLDTGESMDIAFADAYQNTDGTANSNMADVTITVTGENDAPVAVDDTNTMTEDQTSVSGNVITNDTDIDGETLTVVGTPITLNHQYGTLAINSATGGYTFTLNAAGIAQAQTLDTGESMDIAFADAYQNTDGTANSNMADVTITVTGENDAPVAVDDTNTMTEDQTSVSGNVITNDTDIDGETLTVVGTPITLNHQYGTLAINSATGGYTFTLNAAGIAQAQTLDTGESMDIAFADAYQNTDGTANSNMADVTITVTGENDAPVAVDDTNTMTEDQTSVSGNVITNDTDIDGETLTVVGTPITLNHQYGTLAINSATGGYTFTLNAAGIAQAQTLDTGESMDIAFADAYQNTDGTANSNMADVTITVTGENDAPVVEASAVTISEEGLSWANPDLYALPTTTLDSGNARVASGSITITDPDSSLFTVTLSAPTTPLTSGGQAIVWTGAGTSILVGHTGSATGEAIVTIGINDSGAYTVALSGQLDHAHATGDDSENLLSFNVGVSAYDGTTTTTNSNAITVTVEDDMPFTSVTNGLFQNGAGTVLEGNLASMGADIVGAHVNWTSVTQPTGGLTAGGTAVTYDISGSTITATAGGAPVFTLVANADGTYQYTQSQPFDLSIDSLTGDGFAHGAAPAPTYYWYKGGTASTTLDNTKDVLVTLTATNNGSPANVKPTSSGFGVNDGNLDSGDKLKLDFDNEGIADGSKNNAYLVKLALSSYAAGVDTFAVTGKLIGGATEINLNNQIVNEGGITYLVIKAPTGELLDYVNVEATGDKTIVKIDSVSTFTLDDSPTKPLTFGFTATDGDHDSVTGSLTITAQNSHTLTGDATHTALAGGSGVDTINGSDGNDIIHGGGGDDIIHGNAGDDHIHGDAGNDTLYGDAGNDTLHGGTGGDIIDGGDGSDTVSYAGSPAGVTVDLSSSGPQSGGDAQGDTITNVENITGSSYDDHLIGDGNANVLDGGAGNDTMTGGLGADTFKAAEGHDNITDYSKTEGDKVDISHVIDEGAGDYLGVSANPDTTVKLSVFDSGGAEKGSVSFDNIHYSDLTSGDELNSLLDDHVDVVK